MNRSSGHRYVHGWHATYRLGTPIRESLRELERDSSRPIRMKSYIQIFTSALLGLGAGCGGADSGGEPAVTSDAPVATTTDIASAPSTSTPLQTEGGRTGPVLYSAKSSVGGDEALIDGTLRLENDCLLIESEAGQGTTFVALWPFGTIWDDVESTVVLSDGTRISPGDNLQGGGGYGTLTSGSGRSAGLREGLSSCLDDDVTEIAHMQYLPITVET